jgi:transposase
MEFEAVHGSEVYGRMTRMLCEQEYCKQKCRVKGILRRYVAKMTGLSRAQVARLIGRYQEQGAVRERSNRRNRFARRYPAEDTELLSAVDQAHENLNGPANRRSFTASSMNIGTSVS